MIAPLFRFIITCFNSTKALHFWSEVGVVVEFCRILYICLGRGGKEKLELNTDGKEMEMVCLENISTQEMS